MMPALPAMPVTTPLSAAGGTTSPGPVGDAFAALLGRVPATAPALATAPAARPIAMSALDAALPATVDLRAEPAAPFSTFAAIELAPAVPPGGSATIPLPAGATPVPAAPRATVEPPLPASPSAPMTTSPPAIAVPHSVPASGDRPVEATPPPLLAMLAASAPLAITVRAVATATPVATPASANATARHSAVHIEAMPGRVVPTATPALAEAAVTIARSNRADEPCVAAEPAPASAVPPTTPTPADVSLPGTRDVNSTAHVPLSNPAVAVDAEVPVASAMFLPTAIKPAMTATPRSLDPVRPPSRRADTVTVDAAPRVGITPDAAAPTVAMPWAQPARDRGDMSSPETEEAVASGANEDTAPAPIAMPQAAPAMPPLPGLPARPAEPGVAAPSPAPIAASAMKRPPIEAEPRPAPTLPPSAGPAAVAGPAAAMSVPHAADRPLPVSALPAIRHAPAISAGVPGEEDVPAADDVAAAPAPRPADRSAPAAMPGMVPSARDVPAPDIPAPDFVPLPTPDDPASSSETVETAAAASAATDPAEPMTAGASPDAAAPAKDTAPVEPRRSLDLANRRWVNQLAEHVAGMVEITGRARIALTPERLGPLQIELVDGADGLSVRLEVATEAAQRALQDAETRLAADARSHGVRIADTQVVLAADATGTGQQLGGGQHGERRTPLPQPMPTAGRPADTASQPTPDDADDTSSARYA